MMIKTLFLLLILSIGLILFISLTKSPAEETPIDERWWKGLSEEWKTILLINQAFSRQGINVFALQQNYVDRRNTPGDAAHSEMNTPLHEYNEWMRFSLSYRDLYARAVREHGLIPPAHIDLNTLADLDTIYAVNVPGNLTPLKKFPHLRVLIINYGATGYDVPVKDQQLDLDALKELKHLRVLHCSSPALQSIDAVRNLVELEELICDNSPVVSLMPLKKLVKLRKLAVGPALSGLSVISNLAELEEVSIAGIPQTAPLGKLRKLKKLTLSENELALTDPSYRIHTLHFLSGLSMLEYLDLRSTSYRGSLKELDQLTRLKAVTLPRVSSTDFTMFKMAHENCVVLNAYEYER